MADAPAAPAPTGGRRRGLSAGLKRWRDHVSKTMKHMRAKGTFKKGDNLTKVLKEAKKTYHKRGGADDDSSEDETMAPAAETGGRRKTRRRGGRKH